MVRYKKSPMSARVQDRRGVRRPGRVALGGGGLGLGGLLLIVVLSMCTGTDLAGLGGLAGELAPPSAPVRENPLPADPAAIPDDALGQYMNAVYIDNDLMWQEVFEQAGEPGYRSPDMILFTDFTNSGCGGADARVGPHYCPLDESIYLDVGFFEQLSARFGASGDLAPAYVVAHEFAHHIQTVLGISEQVRSQQAAEPSLANDLSIAMELQADCFAGVWLSTIAVDTTSAVEEGYIEIDPGEIREAIEAAEAVGDDRVQRAATGMVNPEQWTHGSAEQRASWLMEGFSSGDPGRCDTFSQLG